MPRTDAIEDAVSPLLNVLVPLEEIEYQLMPHLVPSTLVVRCDEVGGYVWGIRYGTMVPEESAPFRFYWERLKALYYSIINPNLLDALNALPEETKSEGWYKVYRLCAEEVYFGEIRLMHPEDLEDVLYDNAVKLKLHLHKATVPAPESLNA